ncbi:hypothetical protein [Amycolatopsis sp. cmx-4-61]|uniref:hypothetical protein n=1 Tax=Amycolatopsis sp. cmx-4-61 TaxID=2790937 RepID=UPI0039791E79
MRRTARPHLAVRAAAASDPAAAAMLVEGRAWSDERYAAWLGRLWVAALPG